MYRSHVLVCGGTGCTSSHSAEIIAEFEKEIAEKVSQTKSRSSGQAASVCAPWVR